MPDPRNRNPMLMPLHCIDQVFQTSPNCECAAQSSQTPTLLIWPDDLVRFSRIITASADHIDCEFVRADDGVRIINTLLAQPLHLKVESLPF
jgi:hypothetical protein